MPFSFTILLHNISSLNPELIVLRQNKEPLIEPFISPYTEKELGVILRALELLNREHFQLLLSYEDKIALSEIWDTFSKRPYWNENGLIENFPKVVGQKLYEALFPSRIGEEYRNFYNQIIENEETIDTIAGFNLNLQFEPGDPISSRYPWELICKNRDSIPIIFNNKILFSRHVVTGEPTPVLRFESPLRIMIVTSRPEDASGLTNSEQDSIETILRNYYAFEDIELIKAPPIFDDFLKFIIKYRPNIIHFDGHGAFGCFCPACESRKKKRFVEWYEQKCPETDCCFDLADKANEGFLVFEDKYKNMDLVSASKIGERVTGLGTTLFFLSACQTATIGKGTVFNNIAPMLVNSGIPAIVAMQFSIDANEAGKFSNQFYESLLEGRRVESAISDARRLLRNEEIFRPVFYLRVQPQNDKYLKEEEYSQIISELVNEIHGETNLPIPIYSSSTEEKSEEPQFERNLVEFVNRVYELNQLQKPTCPEFVLLNASAGYGKTFLLLKLKQIYGENETSKCLYINFEEEKIQRSSIDLLLKMIKNTGNVYKNFDRSTTLSRLKNVLASGLMSSGIKSVLLMFDSINRLQINDPVVKQIDEFLWNDLIPSLEERFKGSDIKFRVIFSGRYIKSLWRGVRRHKLKEPIKLSAFDKTVVIEAIQHLVLKANLKLSHQKTEIIAEQVVYITGGHPKCIMDILHEIAELNFAINTEPSHRDYFFSPNEQSRMVNEYVDPAIDDILRGVDTELRSSLLVLSVFRGFNTNTINGLKQKKLLDWGDSARVLLASLTRTTHLINHPTKEFPLYSDNVARLMLASKLRIRAKEQYKKIASIAKIMYENWVKGFDVDGSKLPNRPSEQLQIVFIVEGLYHLSELLALDDIEGEKAVLQLEEYMTKQIFAIKSTFGDEYLHAIILQLEDAIESDEQLRNMIVAVVNENGYDMLLERLNSIIHY